jgi:hypothetical protein
VVPARCRSVSNSLLTPLARTAQFSAAERAMLGVTSDCRRHPPSYRVQPLNQRSQIPAALARADFSARNSQTDAIDPGAAKISAIAAPSIGKDCVRIAPRPGERGPMGTTRSHALCERPGVNLKMNKGLSTLAAWRERRRRHRDLCTAPGVNLEMNAASAGLSLLSLRAREAPGRRKCRGRRLIRRGTLSCESAS